MEHPAARNLAAMASAHGPRARVKLESDRLSPKLEDSPAAVAVTDLAHLMPATGADQHAAAAEFVETLIDAKINCKT